MIYEKVKVEESIEPIYVRNSFSKPEREKKAKKNREKEKAAFEEVMSWPTEPRDSKSLSEISTCLTSLEAYLNKRVVEDDRMRRAALLSSMNTKNGAIEASEPTVIKNSDVVENASEENGKIDITEPVNKEYIREKAHDKSVNVVAAGAIDKENSCAEENSSSNSATIITTEQVIEDNKYIGEKEQTSHHVELSNLIQDDKFPSTIESVINVKPPPTPTKQSLVVFSKPIHANTNVTYYNSREKTPVRCSKYIEKVSTLSNKTRILKALEWSVFPGLVNKEKLDKAIQEIEGTEARNFLVLFRDEKRQYRGLYMWNQETNTAEKLSGLGPDKCTNIDVKIFYKYDFASRSFVVAGTKNFINTIDGFTIQESYWKNKGCANVPRTFPPGASLMS